MVLYNPDNPSHALRKRVVATWDDTWRIRQRKIPKGYVHVRGDNHPMSLDSKNFGPIPIESILGITVCKVSEILQC